jgi:hypothetical protein
MSRASLTMAIVWAGTLWLGSVAHAAPPSQPDIEACSRQAAAVTGQTTEIATGHQHDGAHAGAARGTEDAQPSASPPDSRAGQDASTAYRSAFAACLAEHGYYKGYYREHGGSQ